MFCLGINGLYTAPSALTRGIGPATHPNAALAMTSLVCESHRNETEKEDTMLGFLIALIAGGVTPMLETPIARPVARMMGNNVELADGELRALAFMVAMIIAGILCAVFSTGTPLSLAIGGTLGYFGMRLLRWGQRAIEDRRS